MTKETITQPAIQRASIEEIKRVNEDAGQHWFDPGTMRFFGSRIVGHAYTGGGGTFFVSSEGYEEANAPRRYSVREAVEGGRTIKTVGEFRQYESAAEAKAVAVACADGTPDEHAAFLSATSREKPSVREPIDDRSRAEQPRREQERSTGFDPARGQR